jgi:hypothetical protein
MSSGPSAMKPVINSLRLPVFIGDRFLIPNPSFVMSSGLSRLYFIHSGLTAAPTTRAITSHYVQYLYYRYCSPTNCQAPFFWARRWL